MNNLIHKLLTLVMIASALLVLVMLGMSFIYKGTARSRVYEYGQETAYSPDIKYAAYQETKDLPQEKVAEDNIIVGAAAYLRLLATFVEPDNNQSMASIKNVLTNQTMNLKTGDAVEGWILARIDQGKAVLNKHGRDAILHLVSVSDTEAITVLSPTQRIVNKQVLSKEIGDMNNTLRAVSVKPGSDAKGLKIDNIKDTRIRTLVEKAGLKEGDTIISINGSKPFNIKNLIDIYNNAMNEKVFTVKLDRKGKKSTLTYHME